MPKFDAGGKHDPSSSIAARDPKRAAEVLAELMGGSVVPSPPNPGSFFALQLDEHGSGVEVYPAGTKLQPGGVWGNLRQVGRAWQCLDSNRGPFHVIDVWVQNKTMVEILPPEYAREYLAFTRPDKVKAAMVAAPISSARQHRS